MRGKRVTKEGAVGEEGITPAGAGKTSFIFYLTESRKDHPRRCGENKRFLSCRRDCIGSPPQVRGKHSPKSEQRAPFGITPAGAGKTLTVDSKVFFYNDHPRRCGENLECVSCFYCIKGSPPQVRGKLSATAPFGAHVRDHPRRCGENIK